MLRANKTHHCISLKMAAGADSLFFKKKLVKNGLIFSYRRLLLRSYKEDFRDLDAIKALYLCGCDRQGDRIAVVIANRINFPQTNDDKVNAFIIKRIILRFSIKGMDILKQCLLTFVVVVYSILVFEKSVLKF